MTQISYLLNRLASISISLASWCLLLIGAVMSVTIFLQIIFRFVVYVPMPWSEELARYLMIWMGMLGAAVALRNGRHIGVTFFIEKLPERLHHGALALSQVTMIIFLVVVVKEGWLFALSNHSQRSPAMGISMLYPYLAVSVGAGLMILELLADLLHKIFPTQAGSHREMTTRVL